MKIIKNVFSISLINFCFLTLILFYFSIQKPTPSTTPIKTLPTKTPSVSALPTQDTRCIVTVDGSRYDVTVFRNLHSGGDIFTCGADLSQLFHGQHSNRYLSLMARYKI